MEAEQAEACAAEGQPQCDDKFAPVCSMSILITVTNENNEENDGKPRSCWLPMCAVALMMLIAIEDGNY